MNRKNPTLKKRRQQKKESRHHHNGKQGWKPSCESAVFPNLEESGDCGILALETLVGIRAKSTA